MPVWRAVLHGSLAAVAALSSAAARAQDPAGPKFRVNAVTLGLQSAPDVAVAPDGSFVVVWNSDPAGGGWDVVARRFDLHGRPLGAELDVGAGLEPCPSVAASASGSFVVVWTGADQVLGRRYMPDGTPNGSIFVVGRGRYPVVAGTPDGAFVVVWNRQGSLLGRRYAPSGIPMGDEFDTGIQAFQDTAGLAVSPTGKFVVVTAGLYFPPDIAARCFDASGTPEGPTFRVNTFTSGQQNNAAVAADSSGRFVVVWNTEGLDGSELGVAARVFDANCAPLGPDQLVNTTTAGWQLAPDVAADASDAFLLTWRDLSTPRRIDVMGRRISSSGTLRGEEFRVQRVEFTTSGVLWWAKVAGGPEGRFAVVWPEAPSATDEDVFGRRLAALGARPMDVDTIAGPSSDGNGVLEPNETVRVAPAWFNSIERPVAADGTAASFSGPAGPGVSYALADATAAYGTIAPGTANPCVSDCYSLGIVQAAARPMTHWDVRLLEVLQLTTTAQENEWTLHVGDSFTDVARSSPFYRFVETLLHSGVTTGCAAGEYCPAEAATREQMAVFVLKAAEGPDYTLPSCQASSFADVPASSPFCPFIEELVRRGVVGGCLPDPPMFCASQAVTREQMAVFVLRTLDPALSPPACTAPLFGDVPASSPFCRWIEELVRRGVVTGCGGGNYCPAQPVTREQMSVFLSISFGLALYGP